MYYIELLRAIGFTLLLIWVVFISINGIIFFSLFGLFKKKSKESLDHLLLRPRRIRTFVWGLRKTILRRYTYFAV